MDRCSTAAGDILSGGWAKIRLNEDDAVVLADLISAAERFFANGPTQNSQHTSKQLDHGYRGMGVEYSVTPERPDVNESLSLWSDRLDLIPNADNLGPVGPVLLRWQTVVSGISGRVAAALAAQFGRTSPPAFKAASSVQINNYRAAPSDRACLQDRHEDGHMFTLVHGTAPGLELFIDGKPVAVDTKPGELVLMPGSVLTDLTGGAIAPMYHQVRNLQLPRRLSVMYFVNPELGAPLRRWTGDDEEDLRERVRNLPATFGLPAVPVVE